MLVAQNSLGPVCPVPLTVRGNCPYGVQSLPAEIRRLVCKDYEDIDFECSHQACLIIHSTQEPAALQEAAPECAAAGVVVVDGFLSAEEIAHMSRQMGPLDRS